MGMQLEIYFSKDDLQRLMDSDPQKVFVEVKTQPNPDGETGLILVAVASGYNSAGNKVSSIVGCPTPCRPFMDANCLDKTEEQLNALKASFASFIL